VVDRYAFTVDTYGMAFVTTGELIDITAEAFAGRFCGVPDQGGEIGPLAFGSPGGRWRRGTLKVSINLAGFVNPLPPAPPINPVAVVMGAFAQWQATAPFFAFTFVAPNTGEDIGVIFGGSGVDSRFGRAGGVLASAGYPEQGNLQFDVAETWTPNALLATALHEIGHVLGLSHSNAPGGTMYPYQAAALTIDVESRDAINFLYGWQPQQGLDDRTTSSRPCLGRTSISDVVGGSETPQMVWKGTGDDSAIYFSEFRGGWTPQQPVPDVGCSHSPSLTQIPIPGKQATGMLMAWKGVDDDSAIYWTRNIGAGWEAQRPGPDAGTSSGPALATVNGRIYMAWKGFDDDGGIYWSGYDGAESWSPQANVRGVGTSDVPALVGYNDMLYMFWKGSGGDSNVYYSFFDFANDPIWKPQRPVEYFDTETDGGVPVRIGTTSAPSATVRGNRILLAWRGVEGDDSIWFSLFENDEFSGQTILPDTGTSTGPSVVQADDRTYMAWKGIDGDNGIYWSRL
jgi:hypothetical protein